MDAGAHVYVCGPTGMMEFVRTMTAEVGYSPPTFTSNCSNRRFRIRNNGNSNCV